MRRTFQNNVEFQNGLFGYTPLMLAAGDEDTATVQDLLRKGADVNARNKFDQTALHWASDFAQNDVAEAIKVITLLVDAGADVNVQMNNGVTALMMASYRGTREVMRLLMEHGADPNLRRDDGSTVRSFIEDSPSHKGRSKRVLKLLEEFGGTR